MALYQVCRLLQNDIPIAFPACIFHYNKLPVKYPIKADFIFMTPVRKLLFSVDLGLTLDFIFFLSLNTDKNIYEMTHRKAGKIAQENITLYKGSGEGE